MKGITGPDAWGPCIAQLATPFVTCRAPSPVGYTGAYLQAWERTPCGNDLLTL
jgi:hypothetical protein